jgi:aspartate/methionine/tyrosine aminotransferase
VLGRFLYLNIIGGGVILRFPEFCLERWQSLREYRVKINLAESGVYPLTLGELGIEIPSDLSLGYAMTKGLVQLRDAIIDMYGGLGLTRENVLVTNGTSEANLLAVLSLIGRGDEVVVQMPNYMQIYGLLKAINAKVREWWLKPSEEFKPSIDDLNKLIGKNTKAIFISNPNNPTGKSLNSRDLKKIAEVAGENDVFLVFDEVYRGLELVDSYTPSILEHYDLDKAVVTSGLSKVYGLPGIRVGWMISSRKIVNKAWSIKDYTTISTSTLSSYIALKVLQPSTMDRLIERARRIVRGNLLVFKSAISSENLLSYIEPDAGAYIPVKINLPINTLKLAEKIYKEKSVLVNPGECFNIPGYFRIGLGGLQEELSLGVNMIIETLQNYAKESSN